jgi:hypothetical protein
LAAFQFAQLAKFKARRGDKRRVFQEEDWSC